MEDDERKRLMMIPKPKRELMALQRKTHALEMVVARMRRHRSTLLPWDEVLQALKDDLVDQVQANRCLLREAKGQRMRLDILQAWVQSLAIERAPNAFETTWRHSHMPDGDADTRVVAQTWLAQQAFHNTPHALACRPDFMHPYTHVQVTSSPHDDDVLWINVTTQHVLPYSMRQVSDAYWIAEITFAQWRHLKGPASWPPSLREMDLHYTHEETSPTGQSIWSHSLHGRARAPSQTTIISRTIVRDEAFPLPSRSSWIVDATAWAVAVPAGQDSTLLRVAYTMNHPQTAWGFVSVEDIAAEFNLDVAEDVRQVVKDWLKGMHYRLRSVFMEYLDLVLVSLGEEEGRGTPPARP
ncbi:Aste57867_18459 [Aphanomyces stellatus]|uniref:Aste57867_18459 protein n=1 Tax=Aphanomyces stellatus TaxID=120398 RepID=A0A485LA50_9STRA|nr:hypothetical protein As57867_018397 [Aphanomyces stellatus]VFT95195.1 Aste57867_18459 [Aphanomyces stellatus]